ncbi:uncharacterized protein B0H64DRAFT_184421 [Chaetomium fimeti]|uniref:Apple domain-containing protein n=1 Tax=Chaetomium fimeti TaxID=1854472 RepID=A0AAE0HD25_9PEZI|nr:hypothetical protein B0H64DRAFT_184421 [Chaetomium fimeti]
MLSTELQDDEGVRVLGRQNNKAPCPNGNGTTFGTFQEFTALCDTNLNGDFLDRIDAFDFTTCVDLCSSFHPKCEGASFDGSRCTLRNNLRADNQRFSRRSESAIASFPGASSNCVTLGGAQDALGTRFTTMCGFIINGNDMGQNFAPTFQDCLGQCAATTGCAAISFDPSQDLGFKNCYLKTAVGNPRAIAADRRTDSALVAAAEDDSDSSSAAAPPTSSPEPSSEPSPDPSPSNPGVSTIPLSSAVPAGGGGVVFFTPPPGASTTLIPSTLPATSLPAPATTNPVTDALSSSLATTPPFPFPFPSSSSSTPPLSSSEAAPDSAAGQGAAAEVTSMAWVAAPVVGGVAAVALVAVSFVLLRRRRRGGAASGGGEGENEKQGGSFGGGGGLPGWLAAWLPASWASSSSPGGGERGRGRGRRMTGMGNFSEVESGRRGSVEVRGVVRDSVVGFVTGRPMGMERLEDIEEGDAGGASGSGSGEGKGVKKDGVSAAAEGKAGRSTELRASFNGLGQNKWSQ